MHVAVSTARHSGLHTTLATRSGSRAAARHLTCDQPVAESGISAVLHWYRPLSVHAVAPCRTRIRRVREVLSLMASPSRHIGQLARLGAGVSAQLRAWRSLTMCTAVKPAWLLHAPSVSSAPDCGSAAADGLSAPWYRQAGTVSHAARA